MEDEKPQKIARGWQYTVYANDLRVIKIPNPRKTIRRIMLIKASPMVTLNPKKFKEVMDEVIKSRENGLNFVRKNKINLEILGNPSIIEDKIEQDRVVLLGEVLRNSKNPCKYVDEFIKLIFKCWRNGFSERVYNLTINNGLNEEGEVILIDFGEITSDKEKAVEAIKEKRWLKSWSYKKDLPRNIKEYYAGQMEKHITLKNLNKYWKNK